MSYKFFEYLLNFRWYLLIKDTIFAPSITQVIVTIKNDLVAQLVEHLPFKERVLGSSPSPVTKKKLSIA